VGNKSIKWSARIWTLNSQVHFQFLWKLHTVEMCLDCHCLVKYGENVSWRSIIKVKKKIQGEWLSFMKPNQHLQCIFGPRMVRHILLHHWSSITIICGLLFKCGHYFSVLTYVIPVLVWIEIFFEWLFQIPFHSSSISLISCSLSSYW
jgi:hypothetical protein